MGHFFGEVVLIVLGWGFVALFAAAIYHIVFHPLKTLGAAVEAFEDASNEATAYQARVDSGLEMESSR
jgi:hypothetical protein